MKTQPSAECCTFVPMITIISNLIRKAPRVAMGKRNGSTLVLLSVGEGRAFGWRRFHECLGVYDSQVVGFETCTDLEKGLIEEITFYCTIFNLALSFMF